MTNPPPLLSGEEGGNSFHGGGMRTRKKKNRVRVSSNAAHGAQDNYITIQKMNSRKLPLIYGKIWIL